jgi:predicted nucleotidyltransferase
MRSPKAIETVLTRHGSKLREFCHKHPITRLELFGSAARGEQTSQSDIDLLVTFAPGTPKGMAHFAFVDDLEKELAALLDCKVDLIERESLEDNPNPLWKKLIFSDAAVLYAAA